MHRASDSQQALSQGSSPEQGPIRVGFGLRVSHYDELSKRGISADFAEVTTENFLGRGGRALAVLERVRADRPIALHGVSLSIGGIDPLNESYLAELAALAHRIDAMSVSDHLCFGTFGGHYAHDLWPLPYTEEALVHVVTRAGAGILLDVNNVFVSATNHGFSPEAYLDGLPAERVQQIHLAGHSDGGGFLLDDHGSQVTSDVWRLYERALTRFGSVPTIIEWDERVPPLAELEAEAEHARAVATNWFASHLERPGRP